MTYEFQLRLLPQYAANEATIKESVSREKGLDARTITHVRVLKRSIDARQRKVFVNLKVRVYVNEEPQDEEYDVTEYHDVSSSSQVVVVGAGPGGLFAALHLIELGLRPVVVERGKNVRDRKKDMALITKTTENCIHVVKNVGTRGKFLMFFANMELQLLYWQMLIRILVQTNCHV